MALSPSAAVSFATPELLVREIGFDTETWLIQPGRLAPPLVCMSWHDGTKGGLLLKEAALNQFEAWLRDPNVRLVGANSAFDCGVMAQARPSLFPLIFQAYEDGRIICVQVFEKLRKIALGWGSWDPRTNRKPSYTLASLVSEYLAEEMEGKEGADVWRFRYNELDGVPLSAWPEAAKDYALEDARYTIRVRLKQQSKDESPDFLRQCAHAFWLFLSSAWGFRTDPVAVTALRERVVTKVEAAYQVLIPAGLVREAKNGKRSKNMKVIKGRIIHAYMPGIPEGTDLSTLSLSDSVPVTPSGQPSTSEETLRGTGDALLIELADIGTDSKLLSTYVPVLEQGIRWPINPGYDVLKESGRTSSFKPNIQNLPRDGGARECFVPRPGYIYVNADYSAAEMVGFAQILVDMYGVESSALAQALIAGQKPHLLLAADVLGITYEECVIRHKLKDPIIKIARQLAKAGNFGFMGALGPHNFVRFAFNTYNIIMCGHGYEGSPEHTKITSFDVCEACVDAARELKESWYGRFPEARDYHSDMGRMAQRAGGHLDMEQHRSERMRGGCNFKAGCNTLFQGIVADGAKLAGWRITKEAYSDPSSVLYKSRLRIPGFIHDEFLGEALDDLHRGADSLCRASAHRMSKVMIDAMQVFCPDIPVQAEEQLMRRWYKGAEPAFNEAGLLIPWEPQP